MIRSSWNVWLLALSALLCVEASAQARHCGAVRYSPVCCEREQFCLPEVQCRITYKESIEERSQLCYKPVYRTVMKECKSVCYRPVYETTYRDTSYTVCKPVWECFDIVRNYTVLKPIYEQCVREENYTVQKPVWQTYQVPVKYNTYRPVYEQRVKEEHFTVQKPIYYEEQVPCTRTVMKPVYTTETRDIAETIYESVMEPRETVVRSYSWEPVCTEQQICVQTGSWRTEICEIPGQVVMRKVCHPGFWTMDPCCCKMIYVSGHVSCSPVQLPNRTICARNIAM